MIFKNHHSTGVGQHHSFLSDKQCVRHWHCWYLSCSHHIHAESNIPQCLYDLKKEKKRNNHRFDTLTHTCTFNFTIHIKMVNKSTVVLIYKMYLKQNRPFCTASAIGVTPYLFAKSLLQPASHSIYMYIQNISTRNHYNITDQCSLM